MTHSVPEEIVPDLPAVQLPRPITVLINTNSRRGKMMFRPAIQALRREGVQIAQAHAMKSREETARILKSEIELGARLVIVGGGDGTLSTVADILVHTEVAMGVLPLGTGNTFVRSIGLPVDLDAAAKVIAHGHIEAIDVGRVNKQIFLNSVSLGLSSEIASALDKRTKKRLGLLAWPVVGARVVATHRPLMAKVLSDEKTFAMRTHQLVIANGRYVAGPIAAAPDATVQNAQLAVFTLGGATFKSLARTALAWLLGRHVEADAAKYFVTDKLRVESLRRPLRANVDGEVNETTPLEIEVLPGALRVVVPHDFDAETA